jgi:predicted ABC-type ATPase
VLAGADGVGKSSLAGAAFRWSGAEYFDSDEAAADILTANPGLPVAEATAAARRGKQRLLKRAIAERLDFAFETTLGGHAITTLLEKALDAGIDVRVWYVGVDDPERHLARVRAQRAHDGHDIPEAALRERYDRSRLNVIELMPRLAELRAFDNSVDADPRAGGVPQPALVLHWARGRIVEMSDLAKTPRWAKAVVAAAVKLST